MPISEILAESVLRIDFLTARWTESVGCSTRFIAILRPILSPSLFQFETKSEANEAEMLSPILKLLWKEEGQDIAEYAVMLAVILVLVVGTIRLVGSNANNAFSQAASAIQ